MNYRPTLFGSVSLPGAAYKMTGGAKVAPSVVSTLGGSHDANGSSRALYTFPYSLVYAATVVETGGVSDLGATLQALRAMAGVYDRLWVTPMDTTQSDWWAWARCVAVPMTGTVYNRKTQPVNIEFQVESPWYGEAHGGSLVSGGYQFGMGLYYDATEYTALNASPKSITVNNAGDYPVNDCGLTIKAGDTAITYVKVGVASVSEFEWTGSLTAGQLLTIDCGKRFIRANGVDGYDQFQLTSNHTIGPWIQLASGDNTVVITYVGGGTGSTAVFTYSDTWA